MKRKMSTRMLALILTVSLSGCGANTGDTQKLSSESENYAHDNQYINNDSKNEKSDISDKNNSMTSTKIEDTVANELTTEQRNSFSMMYYLAITAEEIRTSKDNRAALEDIYTSLLNDINPGTVDEITQDHLKNLRDIIKSYLNISTKRERLQFIYNQEKAMAMRNAVPDPLAILSVANSLDWKKLAITVAYTAVDSYNNYKQAEEKADMAFIMSGWELDDEEKETIMKNRDRAFDYMVDMVQEYKLDGLKTLNEDAIKNFADIGATENPSERIKLLRANESTYSLLGNYWLELADAYFETDQYTLCLECVENYNNLATGIYRQDFNYLQVLPKAIVAAQKIYSGDQYIDIITQYAKDIIANTSIDDWSTRYFVAQVYLDLYAKTSKVTYLEDAYKIASENVTVLLKNQRTINETYLNDIVEQTAIEPDYRYMTKLEKKEAEKEFKTEKKRVKNYNKALKKKRKTELPMLYEPLILNCELLFSLADELNIDDSEKAEIEAILETDTNGIFICKPINNLYSFTKNKTENTILLSKDEIIIPANLLTAESKITVTVSENKKETTFDDCKITAVKRKKKDINAFMVHISSKKMKKYNWTSDSKVTISITYGDVYDKTADFQFIVSAFKDHWYGDKVVFTAQ